MDGEVLCSGGWSDMHLPKTSIMAVAVNIIAIYVYHHIMVSGIIIVFAASYKLYVIKVIRNRGYLFLVCNIQHATPDHAHAHDQARTYTCMSSWKHPELDSLNYPTINHGIGPWCQWAVPFSSSLFFLCGKWQTTKQTQLRFTPKCCRYLISIFILTPKCCCALHQSAVAI